MSREAWRPHIEDALTLTIGDLRIAGFMTPGKPAAGTLAWTHEQRVLLKASCSVVCEDSRGVFSLSYPMYDADRGERRTAEYVIQLTTTHPHLGGMCWWFHCPYTGRRARKLYLFPGSEKFCCRTAIHPAPTYLIQRMSGLRKATLRRWALRERIGSADSLFSFNRPKGMHQRTFVKYQQDDATLEREELLMAQRRFGIDVCQLF